MSGGDASPTVLTIWKPESTAPQGLNVGWIEGLPRALFLVGSLSPYPLWLLNTVGVDLRVRPEPRKYKQRVLGRAF